MTNVLIRKENLDIPRYETCAHAEQQKREDAVRRQPCASQEERPQEK